MILEFPDHVESENVSQKAKRCNPGEEKRIFFKIIKTLKGYISRSSTINFLNILPFFKLKIQFPIDLNRIQTRNSSADKNPDFAGFLPQLATSDFLSIISVLLIIRGF